MPTIRRASGLTGNPALASCASVSVWVAAGHLLSRRRAVHHAERVGPEVQRPLRRHRRVLLAQRAGGGVARVDEEPLPQLGLALVHRLELGDRHVDLAAHLEHVGVGAARLGQLLGHVVDGGHVRRHVLAGHAVAPRGRLHELPALVGQRHGDAVDLGLARERQRLQVEVGRLPPQPLRPGAAARPRRTRCRGSSSGPGGGPPGTAPTAPRPRRASASRASPARDSPPRAGAAPRRGGRTRRRGSRAHRACGTARCCARSAPAAPRPGRPPSSGRRPIPCRPRSGGDARADHGVGVERVVERHRLARRDGPLRVVEADLHAVVGPAVAPRCTARGGRAR